MAYFLGLDSSTQSLSAIVIDTSEGRVVVDESVNFGSELPAYESPQGVLPSQDPRVRHSDPLMWVEALELLLTRVRERGFNWSKIAGISGAGQQHGQDGYAHGADRGHAVQRHCQRGGRELEPDWHGERHG